MTENERYIIHNSPYTEDDLKVIRQGLRQLNTPTARAICELGRLGIDVGEALNRLNGGKVVKA
ncbi:hypothetical protein ACFOPQ_01225 [Deinococcus antarcticus]|uniref:Uncharacterized protein n=1 Tax=Deinococcus antarcticus TaxID=1298767 RepID=A0ABV8A2D8_9DEIO